jgi:hypothetical protein
MNPNPNPLVFIAFLKQVLIEAKVNGVFQNAEVPQDHMFFLIFMSAILANDNFMGTWFSKTPRRLLFQNFIDNVTREFAQPNSLSMLLSRMDAYLRIHHLQEYDKPCRCWTEKEISVWKLAILYFFEMFVFESLAGPLFLNIQLTEDLINQLRTNIARYQICDPELSMMGYFSRKAIKFADRIKYMMAEHQFWEDKNPLFRLTEGARLKPHQKFNFCDFCKKINCTRCRLCKKHECGCCKQCETPDSCCKLCRLCTSCSQHDHSECSLKLTNVSGVLFRFLKLVKSLAIIRFLRLRKLGSYCYLCNRENDTGNCSKGVLPCGHHFCEKCTRRMINPNFKMYQRTVCPLCFTKIGGYRGIIFTIYRVKLCHPLILTTRELYAARKFIYNRLLLRLVLPKRIQMLLNFDRSITKTDCLVCLDKFKDPMLLPCGHVFCQVCINQLQPRQCPSCRKLFDTCFDPSTGIVQFIFGTPYQRARRVYLSVP